MDLSNKLYNLRLTLLINRFYPLPNILKDFEIFFDYNNKTLILCRLDKSGNTLDKNPYLCNPVDSVEAPRKGHVLTVEAKINDESLIFCLDSGAEINLLHSKVKKSILKSFEILKRINLAGAGQGKTEVIAGRLFHVKIGRIPSGAMNTLLTNMKEVSMAFNTSLDGVLGFDYFAPRPIALNYQKQMIYFFTPQRP